MEGDRGVGPISRSNQRPRASGSNYFEFRASNQLGMGWIAQFPLGGWIGPIEFAPVTSEPTLSQPGSSAARMVMLADYFVMGLYSAVSPHSSIPPPSAPS